jgi:glycerol-3-phosphate acyltransferase PlsX
MIKIALDTRGYDHTAKEAIEGAQLFLRDHNDVKIIAFGDEAAIKNVISSEYADKFEIVNCLDEVKTDVDLNITIRNTETSTYKAIQQCAENKVDGLVSAASTGPLYSLAYTIVKTLPQVKKAAFMAYVPKVDGKHAVILDTGANIKCTGDDLVQFAKMGSIFIEDVVGIKNPEVAILNIGVEDSKGYEFQRTANTALKDTRGINYIGFIEPRDLLTSSVNVYVCDGYTGNVVIKSYEGALSTINSLLRAEFKEHLTENVELIRSVSDTFARTFNYKANSGAFVVGLSKNIVKTHGNSGPEEFASSLKIIYEAIKNDLINRIQKALV